MAEEFNWAKDRDSIVFPTAYAVAVYVGGDGCLVIRQERGPMDDGDHVVIVPAQQVQALIGAIQALRVGK